LPFPINFENIFISSCKLRIHFHVCGAGACSRLGSRRGGLSLRWLLRSPPRAGARTCRPSKGHSPWPPLSFSMWEKAHRSPSEAPSGFMWSIRGVAAALIAAGRRAVLAQALALAVPAVPPDRARHRRPHREDEPNGECRKMSSTESRNPLELFGI